MTEQPHRFEEETGNTELWTTIFADGHPDLTKQHRLHKRLPRDPRCRLCLVPFEGLGGWYMRRKGKGRSSRNEHYCAACDGFLETFPGGAEVEMSVLYVDIRNSTGYADAESPEHVSARINSFLDRAVARITDHDGFIMAFYGDCVVAVWPPGFVGPGHAQKALGAARALLADPMFRKGSNAAIPVGIGLHTGPVYISTVEAARGLFRDVSIFGKSVNVTARLASEAAPFTCLVSESVAGSELGETPEQSYDLKGLSEPVRAYSLN
ncbi:MAG: adenylate/guanylate cyclase domain-containing protein [Alphaproteobacteria bacterium]|nr:adenylate/guanylate cyclase domain-containing protein [Alphaproteobacteria bacterium]